MIIGISGKKQAGKTTIANHIGNRISHDLIGFFSYPKRIIRMCFNVHGDQDSQEVKDSMLPCGKTVRQLQQYIGTDIFRAIDENCWINAYEYLVAEAEQSDWPPEHIITPDVRFPNEVKCIHRLGGIVIRLLRNPCNETHESETALDDYDGFDVMVDNRNMTIVEQDDYVMGMLHEILKEKR